MRKQKGFTLVELVVVVMILGILAAVAAPKLLGTSSTASENGLKQTLAVVRDAIERYAAEKGGALPPGVDSNTFTGSLVPYLRGAFPVCPIAGGNNTVKITTTPGQMGESDTPTNSWLYNSLTGDFKCNSTAKTKSEPTKGYDTW